jgi:hypothetical protein
LHQLPEIIAIAAACKKTWRAKIFLVRQCLEEALKNRHFVAPVSR